MPRPLLQLAVSLLLSGLPNTQRYTLHPAATIHPPVIHPPNNAGRGFCHVVMCQNEVFQRIKTSETLKAHYGNTLIANL